MISGLIVNKDFDDGVKANGSKWYKCIFQINTKEHGVRSYSTFDKKIHEKFGIGDEVTMTGQDNAKGYWDMKTMVYAVEENGFTKEANKGAEEISKLPTAPQETKGYIISRSDREILIVRQCCLKAAVQYLDDKDFGDVLKTAEAFVDWVMQDGN